MLALLLIILGITYYTSAKKAGTSATEDSSLLSETAKQTETETITTHQGLARSKVTGKWIDEKTSENVPLAVMYSNIAEAMPQSSISYADVVYESLVEGGITRLCCVFENQTSLQKIGPVRSCRTYYLLFAKEFEAIYVHFGYSEYAESYLAQSRFHSLDGMVYCDFYRSTDRVAPHNAYTSWDGIMSSVTDKGYPVTYPAGYTAPFKFNTDDNNDVTVAGGQTCMQFYPGYPYNKPWFEYNETTKEYLRYQFNGPQIDAETGNQLSFKNILVKYVVPAYYDNGTPNYIISGTGKGLYITDGRAVEVTWVKNSETEGPTRYYYSDGSEVTMNQGKTYICQVETTQNITISDTK
jgi:hypothetical protein